MFGFKPKTCIIMNEILDRMTFIITHTPDPQHESIKSRGYATVTEHRIDGTHFRKYFNEYYPEDGNKEKIICKAYSVPNPEEDKLEAIIKDYRYQVDLFKNHYEKDPGWVYHLELDAHIEENSEEINSIFFANRKKFHDKLARRVEDKLHQTDEKKLSQINL